MSENNLSTEKTTEVSSTAQTSNMTPRQAKVKSIGGKTILKIVAVVLAITVPVVLALTVAAGVASGVGKDNFLSSLSGAIPAERIPLLSQLSKSNSELLRDTLLVESKSTLLKDLDGREQRFTSKVTGEFKGGNDTGTVNLTTVGNVMTSGEGDKGKLDLKISGGLKLGIVNVDLGSEGVKADLLIPNMDKAYMSFNLTSDIIKTLDPKNTKIKELGNISLSDINGKYAKLDIKALIEDLNRLDATNSITLDDSKKTNDAVIQLEKDLRPDVVKAYEETVGDFDKWMTLENKGRESVAGRSSIVITGTLKKDKVADNVVNFVNKIPSIVRDNKEDLIKFCKSIATSQNECKSDSFDTIKELTAADQKDLKDSINMALDYVDFKEIKFWVDAKDNTLLKQQTTLILTDKAERELSGSGSMLEVSNLEISMITEEISRGKKVSITEPTNAADLNKLIMDSLKNVQGQIPSILENIPSGIMNPIPRTPTTGSSVYIGLPCNISTTTVLLGEIDANGSCIPDKAKVGDVCLKNWIDQKSTSTVVTNLGNVICKM